MIRSRSLPARLPSNPSAPVEVRTVRKSITRPLPDTKPPKQFRAAGGMQERINAKIAYINEVLEKDPKLSWAVSAIHSNTQCRGTLDYAHPRFRQYSRENQIKAVDAFCDSDPQLLVERAKRRNERHGIPNYATSSRVMKPLEQKFLASAMQCIRKDAESKPFHIHGESGAVGDAFGNLIWSGYNPKGSILFPIIKNEKYKLHSHPPFQEPHTSSASEPDHWLAAAMYLRSTKSTCYVTNGKDVLQIQPDSMTLVKLIPDPKMEEKAGRFPEAFRLPEPQQPPRPFANHEAPASFRGGWQPPATWAPPPDYPRPRSGPEAGESSTSRKRPASPDPAEPENPAKRRGPAGPANA
jgi:hypothetical protein